MQRRANHRRAVHGNIQVDAARHDRLQGRQLAADAFDGLDDVGTGRRLTISNTACSLLKKPLL